jgi:hypothetical protein
VVLLRLWIDISFLSVNVPKSYRCMVACREQVVSAWMKADGSNIVRILYCKKGNNRAYLKTFQRLFDGGIIFVYFNCTIG